MRHALAAVALAALALFAGCEDGPFDVPPPGDFFCGAEPCEIATHYCIHAPAPDAGVTEQAVCAALPAACGNAPTCACVMSACTGGGGSAPSCAKGGDGSITVGCAGE